MRVGVRAWCSSVSTFSCHLSTRGISQKLKHQNTPTGTSEGTCTSCTGLQVNEYFTDTGGLTDSCPKQDCDTSRCNAGEYLSGCAGVSEGTCVPCTGLATNHYWTSNGGVTDSCQSAACETNCGTGRYRHDCGEAYEGYCESCTGKPENTFYVSDGGLSDSCEHTDCSTDTCNPGYYRDMCGANANTSHPGTCTQCEENCGSGSYRTQCGALYVVFERYSSAKRENIYLLILYLLTRITYITLINAYSLVSRSRIPRSQ